jgi:hypothetical protein
LLPRREKAREPVDPDLGAALRHHLLGHDPGPALPDGDLKPLGGVEAARAAQ